MENPGFAFLEISTGERNNIFRIFFFRKDDNLVRYTDKVCFIWLLILLEFVKLLVEQFSFWKLNIL